MHLLHPLGLVVHLLELLLGEAAEVQHDWLHCTVLVAFPLLLRGYWLRIVHLRIWRLTCSLCLVYLLHRVLLLWLLLARSLRREDGSFLFFLLSELCSLPDLLLKELLVQTGLAHH